MSRWRGLLCFSVAITTLIGCSEKPENDVAGNYFVKAGAILEGHEPVTLRVAEADRGNLGLVYGDARRGRARQPTTAPTAITFSPCQGRPRSGYVGGLIFNGKLRPVALEVASNGSTDLLQLEQ